jgi:prevent-host-death family protein
MAKKAVAESRKARSVTVTEFKARCLGIVEAVRADGHEFVITKRGEAVARLVPAGTQVRSPRGSWKGLVEIRGDIVRCDWSDEFEVTRG